MGYFDENNKLLDLKGVLGRRDFLVNCLIIEMIEGLLVLTPMFYAIFFKPESRALLLGEIRPLWFLILQCVVGLVSTGLYFPCIVRRVRDIVAVEDDNKIFLISSIIAVIIFMGYTPVSNSFLGGYILLFTLLSLFFMKGKITGEKPKSEIIKFNWGAFFGNWVWGLINKVPKTLFILPLFLTTAWFPFMLICGLKGNEWAYAKNKNKFENVELFHLAQKTQSVILTILSPVIAILCVFLLSITLLSSTKLVTKFNPQLKENFQNYSKQLQIKSAEDGFEKVEKVDGAYVFYLDPEEWETALSSDFLKGSILKSAINYTLIKCKDVQFSTENILNNVDTVNKIKIYSEFNNEVLAEINIDKVKAEELVKKLDNIENLKEAQKLIKESYKFNQNPSIP